jgi:hypothetical protein
VEPHVVYPGPGTPLTNVGRDRSDIVAAVHILANVIGSATPSQEECDVAISLWQQHSGDPDGYDVAWDEHNNVVGSAGLTRDVVGKLWGAAILSPFRNRGYYHQLVNIRCKAAHERGRARHALVKARIGASGPILRQAGFAQLATEVCYEKSLSSGDWKPSTGLKTGSANAVPGSLSAMTIATGAQCEGVQSRTGGPRCSSIRCALR